jgi:hypothetical protein
MKNLILLFLVIGAVVSTEVQLSTTAGDHVWKITYAATTTGQFYSFKLTYTKPTVAALVNQPYIAASQAIGVVCMPTVSTFDVTGAARSAFIFYILSSGSAIAANDAVTNWGALALGHLPAAIYTAATPDFVSGGSTSTCALTGATAPTSVVAGVATYTFTVAAACVDLPPMGTAWYAKCFAVPTIAVGDAPYVVLKTIATGFIKGIMDVTFAGTTTTCATTGASTFATGATILAGIAYLQF